MGNSRRGQSTSLKDSLAQANDDEVAAVTVDAFSQLPAEAVIYIWRRDEATKEFANTGLTFAPDEWDVNKVKEKLGGGSFQARVMKRDGDGRKVPAGQRQFKIEGPPKAYAPDGVAATAPVQNGPAPSGSASRESIIDMGIMAMFRQMQETSQMQLAMVQRIMESGAAPKGPSLVEILAAVTPLLTAFITQIGNRKDPNEIAAELLDKMKPTGNNAMADMLKMAEAMTQLRELIPSGGGGGEESPETVALKTFGPVLAEILMERRGGDRGGNVPVRNPVAALPANTQTITGHATADTGGERPVAVAGSTHGEKVVEPAWVTALRPHVGQLARIAKTGRDPLDFAHTVIEFFMPDDAKGMVRELVMQENAAEQVLVAFPALQPFPAWTVEFVEGVRQELCPELYDEIEDESVEAGESQELIDRARAAHRRDDEKPVNDG